VLFEQSSWRGARFGSAKADDDANAAGVPTTGPGSNQLVAGKKLPRALPISRGGRLRLPEPTNKTRKRGHQRVLAASEFAVQHPPCAERVLAPRYNYRSVTLTR
jgi:hypothetical protein